MHLAQVLAVLVSVLVPPEPPEVCSLEVVPGYIPGYTFFTARARKDTVFGGIEPVPVSFRSDLDTATVVRDSVWGQSFVIDRLSGEGEKLLERGAIEAVLVPWAYDPGCETTHWQSWRSMSVRWVEPSERGVFVGLLRPESDWIRGRPTFDIKYAAHFPVTSPMFDDIRSDERLSPDQYFDLLLLLNSVSSEESAARAYRRWAKDHPDLTYRYPADHLHHKYTGSPPPRP